MALSWDIGRTSTAYAAGVEPVLRGVVELLLGGGPFSATVYFRST
jgi:hypothetical protein